MPFCASRCGYCDFNTYTPSELGSHVLAGSHTGLASQWADGVTCELELLALANPGKRWPFDTVFIGGGTPSLLDPAQVVNAIKSAREVFGIQPDAEITAEANPESFNQDVAQAWLAGGVNRMSFGMQSAVLHVLLELDRAHSLQGLVSAFDTARNAGFENLSVDLIYGSRGESLADWQMSVKTAIALSPEHISAYCLTAEKGTALGRRVKSGQSWVDDGDAMAAKYEMADDLLTAAGYEWYEISNWAKPGFECRHNLGYWRNHDWFGVGPGAHSHLVRHGTTRPGESALRPASPTTKISTRWWNVKHPSQWHSQLGSGQLPIASEEVLGLDQQVIEKIMLGVRLREGLIVDLPIWLCDELVADGLIEPNDGPSRVILTRRGRLLADTVIHKLTSTCLPATGLVTT